MEDPLHREILEDHARSPGHQSSLEQPNENKMSILSIIYLPTLFFIEMSDILDKNLLLIVLILWGIPSTYFRSKFRKIVYKTEDWKINIMSLFTKEIKDFF